MGAGEDFVTRLTGRFELATASGHFEAAGEGLTEPTLVRWLYEAAAYRPLWTRPDAVRALLEWVARAGEEGLDPEDYHFRALRTLVSEGRGGANAVDRELLLTDAFVTLAVHLRTGKADPRRLFRSWNYEPDLSSAPGADEILRAIAEGRVDAFLRARRPGGSLYPRLREALGRYRAIAGHGGWKALPAGPTLHPGDRHPQVALLRERLEKEGFLNDDPTSQPELFDRRLEAAVRAFQRLHLLEPDGVVGPATRRALNVAVQRRIDQLRVNMERLRWVYHDVPDTFLGVDLAGFDLHLWMNHGPAWSSAVQVGKPYHQTPVFRDTITYVEINPTWTVPTSITRRELAPKLLKDPVGFLKEKDMELLTASGRPVDPAAVDWSAITPRDFPYVLRQRPGPANALGRIKFMFPNKYNVYLHDTPSKQLFSRTRRAFSHGCIRVQKPLELGELLLRPNGPQWTREHIQRLIDAGQTRRITLKRPMPILILYLTAVPDLLNDPRRIQFRPDFYKRDAKVLKALQAHPREKGVALLALYRKAEAAPKPE